jgi:hypothetical protein
MAEKRQLSRLTRYRSLTNQNMKLKDLTEDKLGSLLAKIALAPIPAGGLYVPVFTSDVCRRGMIILSHGPLDHICDIVRSYGLDFVVEKKESQTSIQIDF